MHDKILNDLGVSCETIDKLRIYVEVLLKWNKKINLISKNTIPDVWMRHIVDSAQIIKFLENRNQSIADIGSGAGLPGVILNILGIENITLVESDERKTSFLREVSRLLGLNLTIINERVENLLIESDIIISRGLSSLNNMLDKTSNIQYYRILLPKGKNVELEITNAKKYWEFDCKKHQSITSIDSYILDITNVRKR
jgi:16S rRNA (guanine527-N7)-methyltransferase